jgi:F0F1-type ATP synthase alpha subunit
LQQGEHTPVPIDAQIALLTSLVEGKFDHVPLADMPKAEQKIYAELDADTGAVKSD